MQLVGRAGVELEVARHGAGVRAGLAQRLAGVAGLQRGQFVLVLHQHQRHAVQQADTLCGCHGAPGALGGLTGGQHGHADVRAVATGNLGERLAVGGIENLDAQTGIGGDQAVGDEVLGVHAYLRARVWSNC
ncbi:hypothetical protein D3C72_1228830 [compost metagenome]